MASGGHTRGFGSQTVINVTALPPKKTDPVVKQINASARTDPVGRGIDAIDPDFWKNSERAAYAKK